MSELKAHTPGPWRVHQGNCGTMVGILSAEAIPVEMLGRADAINPANAALIAAAPELLAALRTYVEYDEYINGPEGDPRTDRLQKSRAAIAKAEGR